jgi:hypothetical protein
MDEFKCGIETTVNQDEHYEYGGLSPLVAQEFYLQKEGLLKNSRPTQADKNEPLVRLHVSKQIAVFYLTVRTNPIRNCILREELTKPINFYYFKTLECYPRQSMVDRACASVK